MEDELKHNETYTIYNKRLKKFVSGTDRRNFPRYKQILSNNRCLTYDWIKMAETDMLVRKCGKDYKIVKVKIQVVE